MDASRNRPYLLFEFSDKQGKKNPIAFHNPIEIIETNHVEEVMAKLIQVEKHVEEGKYAAGFISYEAAPAFEKSFGVKEECFMPLLWFGVFEAPAQDTAAGDPSDFEIAEWQSSSSEEEYQKGFNEIKKEIEEGNTYQVNYTMRLHSKFEGDDFAFYQQLSHAQAANYSAYLNIGTYRILSASPELFFRLQEGSITTRPMKGTIQRGKTLEEDRGNAEWLYHSEKNRSENLMIVDLLRNDLGSIAKAGTVRVPELFQIEKYPTVWQMTSTVTCDIQPSIKISDIFKALFPCGSITGAPKISTMRIISELEKSPRGVYCGAIGFLTPGGDAVFNVPIRTVVINKETGQAQYGAGGGITWDSEQKDEYHEAFVKARLLSQMSPEFELLESIKLEGGQYDLLDNHLSRILQSAEYFGFSISEQEVNDSLSKFAEANKEGVLKVRCLVARDGKIRVEGSRLEPNPLRIKAALAGCPVSSVNPFLYHKTTNRSVYDTFRSEHPEVFDVLLWNERDELTEFTLGNVVLKIKGELLTPPVSCGLLAGTLRTDLLNSGVIKEKVLSKEHLREADEIWFINSVRGWIKAEMVHT